jgi:hypothetical protein
MVNTPGRVPVPTSTPRTPTGHVITFASPRPLGISHWTRRDTSMLSSHHGYMSTFRKRVLYRDIEMS